MKFKFYECLLTAFFALYLLNANAQTKLIRENFSSINLGYPGLEKVKLAVDAGNYEEAGKALLAYYRKKLGGKPDLSNLEIPVDTTGPLDAKSREIADNGLLHKFQTQESNGFFDFGKDINWQLWPVKDNEVRWQLHRVKWWLPMALAYRSTKDEKYAREWMSQFEDWMTKNPYGLSADNDKYAWRPLEVSDRIQSLVPTLSMFINSPNFTPGFLLVFLKSYQQQADYLPGNYAEMGNHRLFEAQRTLFAGASFPEYKNAPAWRKSGIEVLNKEIKKQVYPDGFQFELSPVYHASAIDIFARAYQGAQKAHVENEFPSSYKQTVEKMAMAFINITFPNYNQPMFGDSWLKEKSFRLKQYASWSEMFPQNLFIKYFATDGQAGQKPNWLSRALMDAGFYTFRNGWDSTSTILMLKASPPGEFHAQPDNGTFELWVNGRNFTPDAGCFVYSGDAEIMKQRDWYRQTRVHSTLTLNNENMVITKAIQNTWQTVENRDVLTFTNPSYKDLNHQRSILFIDQKYFLVIDKAMGNATGNLGIHYQLNEDSQPRFDNQSNSVSTTYKDGNNLLIKCLMPATVLKEEDGKVSYEYGREISRPAFVFEQQKTDKNARFFLTIVYPFSEQNTPVIRIKENAGNNWEKGLLDIDLTINNKNSTIRQRL